MEKQQIIDELNDVIRNIKMDRRSKIKGIKVMIADFNWDKRKVAIDSNLLIEWQ